jgi:uncharacterized protein YdeI (YjbR/CyaY-like superfamily)
MAIVHSNKKMVGGSIHPLPPDLRSAIAASKEAFALWEDITPLACSEWICWVISGKKAETRPIRIAKTISKLSGGMRRPCCWAGCPHRKKNIQEIKSKL